MLKLFLRGIFRQTGYLAHALAHELWTFKRLYISHISVFECNHLLFASHQMIYRMHQMIYQMHRMIYRMYQMIDQMHQMIVEWIKWFIECIKWFIECSKWFANASNSLSNPSNSLSNAPNTAIEFWNKWPAIDSPLGMAKVHIELCTQLLDEGHDDTWHINAHSGSALYLHALPLGLLNSWQICTDLCSRCVEE